METKKLENYRLWYALCYIEHFFFIYVVDVNLPVIYFHVYFQVRLGTEKGAEVVKVAVLMLYALLVAFGLSKILPLTCIVSSFSCRRLYASIFGFLPFFAVMVTILDYALMI